MKLPFLKIVLLSTSLISLIGCGSGGVEEIDIPRTDGKLVQSDNESLLEYFHEVAKDQYIPNEYLIDELLPEAVISTDAEVVSVEDSSDVSSTNTQEAGVDEADLIKTDGRYLYSVDSTDYSDQKIRIMDTESTEGLAEVNNLRSDNEERAWDIQGLYLHEEQKRLVALSSAYTYLDDGLVDTGIDIATTSIAIDPYYYRRSVASIDVMFMDVEEPSNTSLTTTLSFDGSLVDSRRNGDTLYMVLRNSTSYRYVDDESLVDASLEEFLPSYTVDNSPRELITNDCFVEEGQSASSNVITMVAIDLKSETPEINSQCFVGPTEALYASQNALYLATTTSHYDTVDGFFVYGSGSTTVDIHKFGYDGLELDYKGSGEVDGHLGYDQISKQFRFSEHNGYLRVVTFDNEQWSRRGQGVDEDHSPVLLSILEENTSTRSLDLVSTLPNENQPDPIGLPDERLYASRFIGDRGYFITFQKVDPLYVLDLSDARDPKILGELKIEGYSDYLHPISENLILGIGKDAVVAESGDFSWFQGVKLSLFDVTDPANPIEADNIVLGQRGTESTALYTHHGVTGLSMDDTYRLAIPVSLNDTIPSNVNIQDNTRYNYTHTGLYRFNIDINTQTLNLIDPLLVHTAEENTTDRWYSQNINNDRSVIINDDVYYMHGGEFWMQDWEGTTEAVGPK